MRSWLNDHLFAVLLAAIITPLSASATTSAVETVMACTVGGTDQRFHAVVTMPATVAPGATFKVRVDSLPSAKLTQTGLNFLADMRTDYGLPAGARYVEGSARIVPATGTPNILPGATVSHDASGIHMALGAHVAKGDEYTPPSVEFELTADAPAGSVLVVSFVRYQVTANVFVLGNLRSVCDPQSKAFPIGSTRVQPAARARQ